MVVAMLVGMVLLGPLWSLLLPGLTDGVVGMVMVMATDMAIGMAVWMRVRRHSWVSIAEMSGAMYLPFVVLLVPYWAGAISEDALMIAGHVLMLPLIAAAMLLRRSEYQH
jgi:flagellar biosynthetic protein FliP